MNQQAGFSLFELMIAITVIAILTSIAVPVYQSYIQKAAMTELLQTLVPYKTAIELCQFGQGDFTSCNSDNNGIAGTRQTNYIKSIAVKQGVITIIGKGTLTGLTTILTPALNQQDSSIQW